MGRGTRGKDSGWETKGEDGNMVEGMEGREKLWLRRGKKERKKEEKWRKVKGKKKKKNSTQGGFDMIGGGWHGVQRGLLFVQKLRLWVADRTLGKVA